MNIKNLIKGISSTEGRLNRFGFIIILIINIIWWIIVSYLGPILFDANSIRFDSNVFFLKIPFIAFILIASVNRFHDMNKSGWFVLLLFLPIINLWILLWLIIWNWTKWKNSYGEPLEIK